MFAALSTAFFFALSAIFSQRATRIFGSIPAHFFRLSGACLILGLLSRLVNPSGNFGPAVPWLLLSGAIGFGLGDACLFLAYPRLGSRLALLIQFCMSTVTGAVGDWLWLGNTLSWENAAAVVLILSGLGSTLMAKGPLIEHKPGFGWGLVFGLGSAFCMGSGTVVSHYANAQAELVTTVVPPLTQAWLRVSAGVVVAGLVFLIFKRWKLDSTPDSKPPLKLSTPMKGFWLTGTTLMGPVIGITCYQWALMQLKSSAIVLAVAATSALMIMPLARLIEKDKPSFREILGSIVAVLGIAWFCLRR